LQDLEFQRYLITIPLIQPPKQNEEQSDKAGASRCFQSYFILKINKKTNQLGYYRDYTHHFIISKSSLLSIRVLKKY
jgi:hypothetical protein